MFSMKSDVHILRPENKVFVIFIQPLSKGKKAKILTKRRIYPKGCEVFMISKYHKVESKD